MPLTLAIAARPPAPAPQPERVTPLAVAGEAARQRALARHAAVSAWKQERRRNPDTSVKPLMASFVSAFNSSLSVPSASSVDGFRLTVRSLLRWLGIARREGVSGLLDGRGRPRGDELSPADDAWEMYRELRLGSGAHRLSQSACWSHVAAEGRLRKWDWPSLPVIRRLERREIGQAVLTYAQVGPRTAEALCVPKEPRDYESIPAGDWWCLDGHDVNAMIRIPDARKGWRRARPCLMGVLDLRSRSLRLRRCSTENSDAILAGIAAALRDWGAPTDVIRDNGSAYRAALGQRKGSGIGDWGTGQSRARQEAVPPDPRSPIPDPRIDSLFGHVHARLHDAIPYRPWVKPIESIWRKLIEGFERWLPSFWGNSPGDRPWDAERFTRERIDRLPTGDEFDGLLDAYLDVYHAQPQSGDGTFGLSPNLVMEQFRGEFRRVPEELLDLVCRRLVGGADGIRVTRDGVLFEHVHYRPEPETHVRLTGQRVWLRIDPDRRDALILCDKSGAPLRERSGAPVEAHQRRLVGASAEHAREAARTRSKYRRILRDAADARDYLRETPTTQILLARRQAAQAAESEQRQALPAPEAPAVTIIKGSGIGERGAGQSRARQEAVPHDPRSPLPAPSSPARRRGFERLAEKAAAESAAAACGAGLEPVADRWARLNYEREAS